MGDDVGEGRGRDDVEDHFDPLRVLKEDRNSSRLAGGKMVEDHFDPLRVLKEAQEVYYGNHWEIPINIDLARSDVEQIKLMFHRMMLRNPSYAPLMDSRHSARRGTFPR